ncbi:MAG: DUF4314 domain-containing protein [Fusobacteriaceae bacterium]
MKNESVEQIKQKYPTGTQVQLVHMEGEPHMKRGLKGIIQKIDDIGQIHIKWENGCTLAINVNKDVFTVLKAGL